MNPYICIPNQAMVIKYTIVCNIGFSTTIPKISNQEIAIVIAPIGVNSVSNWSNWFIYICYFLLKIDVTTLADNKVAEYISNESNAV